MMIEINISAIPENEIDICRSLILVNPCEAMELKYLRLIVDTFVN